MSASVDVDADVTKVFKTLVNLVGDPVVLKVLGVVTAAWSILEHYDPMVVASLSGGFALLMHAIDSKWNSSQGEVPRF